MKRREDLDWFPCTSNGKRVHDIRKKVMKQNRGERLHHLSFYIVGIAMVVFIISGLGRKCEAAQNEEIVETIRLEDDVLHMKSIGQETGLLAVIDENEVQEAYIGELAVAVSTVSERQTLPAFKVESGEEHLGEPLGTFEVTGYCGCEKCCGLKGGLTKTEKIPKAGYTIAADPEVLPMGSKVEIDGIVYMVEDTGGLVKGNVIDIYFDTHEEAVMFGRQKKKVYLVS